MVSRLRHGVFSIVLFLFAMVVGAVAVFQSSPGLAFLYITLCTTSLFVIAYSYCSKCPCKRHKCAHVILGKLALLLPERASGPYVAMDYVGVAVSLFIAIAYPQYWLSMSYLFLGLFWGLIGIAVIDILTMVCKGCANSNCPISIKINA